MARLTLQTAQQHRVWEASLLTTYMGPTDWAVITNMWESGVRYHHETQTSDAARRAQLGPPHVHVFGAMIVALVTQISTITPLPGFAEELRLMAAWLGTASLETVMEMVTVARLSRTRQANRTRVQIRVNHETHAASIRAALCSVGFRYMCGTAPPGTPRASPVEAPVGPRVKPVMPAATDAAERIRMKRGDFPKPLLADARRTIAKPSVPGLLARTLLEEASKRSGSESGVCSTAAPCVDLCLTPPVPVFPECGDATNSLVQDVLGFRAHSCDRIGENVPRASARFEEGTTVPAATQAEMSYGPRSTDTSDCSRFRAHTRERIGENATCTSAAFDEGATVQAAHRVAAPFEEGTTVPAGTQAETCFGRRSADKSVPPVLRFPAHVRECSGEAAPCVTTPAPTLGSPVPRISDHTRDCTGESASLGFASVQVCAALDGMSSGCVDTFLPDTSSRAHLVVGAPVPSGESSGQSSVGISDFPTPSSAALVISGARSGQRDVGVSDFHTSTHVRRGESVPGYGETSDRLDSYPRAHTRERCSETADASDPSREDTTTRAGEQSESSSGRAGEASLRSGELVPTLDAPVFIGESSGQRSVDVSDSPTPPLAAPVPASASSGKRSVDVSDSYTPSGAALGVHVELVQFLSLPAQQM